MREEGHGLSETKIYRHPNGDNRHNKTTRQIKVGELKIGGGAPVSVQSMTNTPTHDIDKTAAQINALKEAGADLVRMAVPDMKAASALKEIRRQTEIPLVADVHFDHKLALKSVDFVDKIRINPGNIGGADNVRTVADALNERGIPIRIGVNAGSLPIKLKRLPPAQALAEAALTHVRLLEDAGFYNTVISVKSSDVRVTLDANRILAECTEYPLHLGVTEAGIAVPGLIKSSACLGALLLDGIGDTIRISLSGDPVKEIEAGRLLLNSLGLRRDMPEVASCPMCGRTEIDVAELAERVYETVKGLKKPLKIAVMGCVVNGIGESEHADLGVCGGKEHSLLFLRGKKLKTVNNADILPELLRLAEEYTL
ncbi:MAG: flavodoxin-dependent (E)-4-hydroxy-3-methylbut-2-enyl-diphosphate synthase [Clostridiales bacterium]|jgi:(E)-4-hydroxy-3-methylbut-2-enyl-diphosphate synthase|nr:flavodoxin-dependent (E)-4-hydroxy-3-methylbut-2-enyl-diphosphate synthase [Clostridiales bacterium]